MDQFQRYEFTAQGDRFTVDALNKLQAMGEANEHFGSLPQGAWMETQDVVNSQAIGFYWAEGNFFD